MKYIKKFEDINIDAEVGDYMVAYRPYKDSDVTAPITIDYDDYVIEVGIVTKVFLKETRGPMYSVVFSVVFPGGRYMRLQKHILYHSKYKEDADQHAQMLKKANNYNL